MSYTRVREGVVISAKMQKTVVVRVETVKMHPLYHKRMRLRKKYKVHDEKGQAKEGDRVRIAETRHLSKDIYYTLVEVIKKAEEKDRAVVQEVPEVVQETEKREQKVEDRKQTTEDRQQKTE